jgi:MOSC domain-containing protein YiiM
MTVISVNTGRPREVRANGDLVRTSIWKSPRDGRVRAAGVNLEGDEQSDLTVHGGQYKSVYVYPSEHYEYWRDQLPDAELPWGVFGENLTTEGLLETNIRIGDRIAIGSAEFQVTQPRQPCFKLGIRFGREDMLKRFVASGRSGFYVSIVKEGDVGWGDSIRIAKHATDSITVADIFSMKMNGGGDRHALARAASLDVLTPSWREHFLARLSSR